MCRDCHEGIANCYTCTESTSSDLKSTECEDGLPHLPPPRVVTWQLPSILMPREAVGSVMICFEGAFLVKWNQQALSVLYVTKAKGFNYLVPSAVTPQWVRTLMATTSAPQKLHKYSILFEMYFHPF